MKRAKTMSQGKTSTCGVDAALRLSQVPLEWWSGGPWRLPSGQTLVDFALRSGFLAPLLLRSEDLLGLPTASSRSRTGVPKGVHRSAASNEARDAG
jgi:hypothetical protein